MKKGKIDLSLLITRRRCFSLLIGIGILYFLIVIFQVPLVFHGANDSGAGIRLRDAVCSLPRAFLLETAEDRQRKEAPVRPRKEPVRVSDDLSQPAPFKGDDSGVVSGLVFDELVKSSGGSGGDDDHGFSKLQKSAREAWIVGSRLWEEIRSFSSPKSVELDKTDTNRNVSESCPQSISLSGAEFLERGSVVVLPCGLTFGSHLTVVGKPRAAHEEKEPKIALLKDGAQSLMVSQFMVELQGLKTVEGEEPPRILHFNPRLKGDWSGKPVIEQNTCYRMQWGPAQRCEGWKSRVEEETVDEMVKCEKWIHDEDIGLEGSKTTWWLNRLTGLKKKVSIDRPFPFAEDKSFVITLSAGLEGYQANVDGRHVTSFPYRTRFVLEDATRLSVSGDVDVHATFAASLPSSHPSFDPQILHLETLRELKAPPLPNGPVELFIGILSAADHFAERMAVRTSWMQHEHIKSSNVVARFFVALNGRKEVNVELKKEAEFFGDIVIVPFMDSYDLVVLKTVAICEYGVHTASANYIMKCDDDTFVRVDSVLTEVKKTPSGRSLYVGNMNYYHKPMRSGKWAVTYEEWPEEDYPIYANGPGYIVSSDIAQFVVTEFEKHRLRLFKMEDVSMGMWVEQFNSSRSVEYLHNLKFCQFGCIEDYYTAHYQSPQQMICMWDKLKMGIPECCNMR